MESKLFNHADIEANFDDRDLQRGRAYWRKGAVLDLKVETLVGERGGQKLSAHVRGSEPRPYKTTVTVMPPRPFKSARMSKHPLIESDCSCPVGVGCKHGAAVCLAAAAKEQQQHRERPQAARQVVIPVGNVSKGQQLERLIELMPSNIRETFAVIPRSAAEPKPQPDAWDMWLNEMERVQPAAAAPARVKKCVVYIVQNQQEDRWNAPPVRYALIRCIVASILKDGSYSRERDIYAFDLAQSQAKYASPDDKAIGRLMQGGGYGYGSGYRSPPAEAEVFDLVMRRVIASGRCFLDQLGGVLLRQGDEKPARLGWRIDTDGVQIPDIVLHEDPENTGPRPVILLAAKPWYIDSVTGLAGTLRFDAPLKLMRAFLDGPHLPPEAVADVAKKMAERAFGMGIAPPRTIRVENRPTVKPVPCLRLASCETSVVQTQVWDDIDRIHHVALLHFDYDGITVDSGSPETLRIQKDDCLITMPRHRIAEHEVITYLSVTSGLQPTYARPPDAPQNRLAYAFAHDARERGQWLNFVNHEVPRLRDQGWRIDMDEGFSQRFNAIEADDSDESWQADLREQQAGAWWFSLDLGIMVEGQRVALLPLLVQALKRLREPSTEAIENLAMSGKLYVDLPDGRALALPFERVRDMLTTLIELYDQPLNPDGSMTIPLDLATALSRIDAATRMRWLGGERLKALIDKLKTFKGLIEILPPRGLQATLRPYQREGLNWLQFLREYGLGGILADDMGLGKTVQTLAHILVEKQAKRLDRPCLIICPTSLIPNWQDEAAKFTPNLKVLSLHGKDRATRFGDIDKADLVLTTYPLLTRDTEILLAVEWHIVALDEAQAIKNPGAQVTQLACELKARHRLCLTGTPIENHLGEAWSHFAFLMPGMLGTYKNFTKRFRNPIEKQKDTDRQALLARRLKPFILRRNKSEVAKELPPKTEIIHHVEFESAQRDLYETLRLTMHDKVQEAIKSKGFNRSRIVILDALLKLRQACCDPRLVKLTRAKNMKQSAKLESLMQMLPEMIEEGRRILLFSQFTSMLDLIKPELDAVGITYVEIRGDTSDRKTPVTEFQSGKVPLFLISLKAGGTGLNLTAADTVIHYDPWWNPAVENQATDRAHRMGQDKPVFVYKFIAKGTVEERILELQNRKRHLASALMNERPDATAAFEANDLDFLFQEAG